jgi:adenylate kinase
MRILLVAPPGAGKGTQAELLASHYGVEHLSSGELFRREVAAGTEVGRAVAGYLERGELVPDDLVLQLLVGPILEAVARGGYVLDGFPRSLRQAEAAYQWAREFEDVVLEAVVHLDVPTEVLRERLRARAVSEGRSDDAEAIIERRLEVYNVETRPTLGFYASRGLLVEVNGDQTVDDVFHDMVEALEALRRTRPG